MFTRTVSPADLKRLRHAREAADSAYNAALTRLDAAVRPAGPAFPSGPRPRVPMDWPRSSPWRGDHRRQVLPGDLSGGVGWAVCWPRR